MKLLHTSDWHLGMSFRGRSSAEDQEYFTEQICSIIKERKIDAVIISGDVFDRNLASGEAVALYDRIMTRIVGEMNTPVLSVAGNHDSAERLSQCHELLKKSGLYVAGSLSEDFMTFESDDAQIFLIPWFTTEKARSVFHERTSEINSLEDAWIVVASKIKAKFKCDKKHILVTHAFIVNAETSVSDRAAEVGFATAVGKAVFDGFDYVALGHIHKHQDIGENIAYCGTPMPYSFGKEEKQEKGIIVIDTDDMTKEFVTLKPLHRRTTLAGTYDEILKADYPEDVKNGYVRLEVNDSYVGADAMAQFSEKYPLLIEVKGKDYDSDEADITMSMEDFEKMADNPVDIFREFCREVKHDFTDERLSFFKQALSEYTEEDK